MPKSTPERTIPKSIPENKVPNPFLRQSPYPLQTAQSRNLLHTAQSPNPLQRAQFPNLLQRGQSQESTILESTQETASENVITRLSQEPTQVPVPNIESTVLSMMAVVLLCVWVAHTSIAPAKGALRATPQDP